MKRESAIRTILAFASPGPRFCVFRLVVIAVMWASIIRIARSEDADPGEPERLVAVCSTTQVADFARQVVGDRWKVVSILGPKQDPHTFQVTPRTTRLVSTADICFDNGLHLEGGDWMRTVTEQAGKPIVSCTHGIEPLRAEASGKPVPDPHAWFSARNAAVYVRNILENVSKLDPEHQSEYQSRATLYLDQLRALDQWIQRQIGAIPEHQRLLVSSHDAFNYYCHAYGLKHSTPVGWSTQEVGAEVTPARRKAVIESIRNAGVPTIFVESSVNPELIANIAQEAGVRVGGPLYSDAMGGAGTAGETYIGMMRENTLHIVRGLSAQSTD